jgi:hypothetical protein
VNAEMSEETGTYFPGPLERLGIGSTAELEALSPEELLARSAEATFLEEVEFYGARPEDLRLRRRLLSCELRGSDGGALPLPHGDPGARGDGGHARGRRRPAAEDLPLTLARTSQGWRVRKGDLSGTGMNLIYIPESQRAFLDFL